MKDSNTPAQREEAFDLLRGACIFLVVVWHAWLATDAMDASVRTVTFMNSLMELLSAARMPALMFTAGYFAAAVLRKKGERYFLVRKGAGVLYPAVIWTILMALLVAIKPSTPDTGGRFVSELFFPTLHTWFLQYLCIFFGFTVFIMKNKLFGAICLVAGFAALLFMPEGSRFLYLAHCYMLGLYLPSAAIHRIKSLGKQLRLVVLLVLFCFSTFITLGSQVSKYHSLMLPAAYASIISVFIACLLLSERKARITVPLKEASRWSLEIYLLHWPIILIFSTQLKALVGRENYWLNFSLNFAVGSLGSLAAIGLCHWIRVKWLFKAPSPLLSSLRLIPARL